MKQMLALKGSTKGKKVGGIDVNTVEDFNGETAGIVKILESLLILPCHLLLECHTTKATDIKSGIDVIRLLTGGKGIAAEIPAYFNEVWYFLNEPPITSDSVGTWKFFTRAYGAHECKTAMNLPYSIDFTNLSVYDLLQAHLGKLDISQEKAAFEVVASAKRTTEGKVVKL
jgi:hypothetical protein